MHETRVAARSMFHEWRRARTHLQGKVEEEQVALAAPQSVVPILETYPALSSEQTMEQLQGMACPLV